MKIYQRFFKRPMDIVLSGAALVVLSPVMITVAILVRKKLGSPVLFKQSRPGLNEEIFYMYKFRTMTDERDENGELLADSIRLSPFGKLLRSTSLDELPGLMNIFKGDMSIIGPRPLAVQYLPYYSDDEKKRHLVRPGLSGLAQVEGRNSLQWEERFKLDIQYVNNINLYNDISIIIKTILKAIRREDIGIRGEGSLEDFDSYRKKQKV